MLEAVASQDLWIWHAFYGMTGANNDINVLDNSSLFDDLLDDLAPVVPYVVNGVQYRNGYYLADGIYPEWASFVKSFTVATESEAYKSLERLGLPSTLKTSELKNFCTTSTSYKLHTVKMEPLNLLVIDEAAQLKEAESTIPLQLPGVNHAILIGDECQLPAMVKSKNSMAEQNVPAQPPTRTDEQIVPRSQWLTIGKSNLLFNAQKIQKNPIFQISVDILKNTNFFQALTASANVPAIYLQQFWKTMSYNEKTGVYSCQLDEQWFDLSADLLRKALAITPVNPTHPFELPPTGDTVLDFVNELGYPEPVEFVSSIRTNYVHQPWRAILSLLNQCLTGKTSGSDKPRHPVLQMLNNNIHRRPDSAVHHTGDDYVLGNLKFVPKGETVEVFGIAIPDPLITEAIQQSSYYPNISKLVAANTKKTPRESASVQPATKRATPKKPTTTTPVKQSKPAPPPTKKPSKRKLPQKVRKGKPTFKLVNEDDEDQQETIPHEEGNDPDLELAMKLSLETPQEKGEGEGDDADLERAIKLSLDPALLPQGRAPVGGVTIREPGSEATSKLHEVVGKGKAVVTEEQVAHSLVNLSKKKRTTDQSCSFARQRTESETETAAPQSDKGQDDVDSSTVTSGVSIPVSVPEKDHEALAGPDPEPMNEDQTGSDHSKNYHSPLCWTKP
ncbi:monodehydroascorbate reductase [Tanacetum coccineum]|uniref:Monodehydroascorbate reductase n=1 Tax=Tanacetum coccineum TaxID=301880 RepID=A0ABQ5BT05_9ASTR